MQYFGIGVFVVAIIAVFVILIQKLKSDNEVKRVDGFLTAIQHEKDEQTIQLDMIPMEAIADRSQLVEITDKKTLAHVNNLIPNLGQFGNVVNNAVQAGREAGRGVLYKAIIPVGQKLTESKDMNGAFRGMYHGAGGIKGHANLLEVKAPNGTSVVTNSAAAAMGVASMIVGQYYMTQINSELDLISDGISQIADFQDNEYRSRVFSLIAHIKKIADFQTEILNNDELRLSKIAQLDSLEEECTKLLGHANLTLAGFAKEKKLSYKEYEKALGNAQNWFMYQKSLLDILYKISDLRYTLHFGTVTREQCGALLTTFTKQVTETKQRLIKWHQGINERLSIDIEESRRKRTGFDGVIHFLPGVYKEEYKFRSIMKETAGKIINQTLESEDSYYRDTSELYDKDVQLISEDGKIYYLPERKVE